MTLVVVVGAGASHDCNPVVAGSPTRIVELRPGVTRVPLTLREIHLPLTFGLFEERLPFFQFVNDYGAVRPLLAELSQTKETLALEERLAEYAAAADTHPSRHSHLMAMRFYLRDIIRLCTEGTLSIHANAGQTNYVPLVQQLREWAEAGATRDVVAVSFNYDTLLEQACSDVWQFDSRRLSHYLTDPYFKILKPHGSIEWSRGILGQTSLGPFSHLDHDEARIERARTAITLAGPDLKLGPIQVAQDPFRTANLDFPVTVPALAPPLKDKSEFEWPDEQRAFIEGLSKQVDRLLVIGWRALDRHFVELLKATFQGLAIPTLVVTGGDPTSEARLEAQSIAERLGVASPKGDNTNVTHFAHGFSRAIQTGAIREWLADPTSQR